MKTILFDWVCEGLLAILLVYLSAIELEFVFTSTVKKRLTLQLSIVTVCAIYTAITWTFYSYYTMPLGNILPWIGLIILSGMGLKLASYWQNEKNIFTADVVADFLSPIAGFFIFFIILAALYSVLVADRRLPVAITENNDIWAYAKFTHLVLGQPIGNNIVGTDLLKTRVASQTPTAFMLLAGLAYYTGQNVVDILSVGLILILTSSAYLVKELCVRHWHIRTPLAYLIALAWVTSSFSFYLASNYFFAQWLGICLFLATLLVVLRNNKENIPIQTATLSLLNYLTFMTYPALFFPYMGILLFIVGIEAAFSKMDSGAVFFNSSVASALFSIPISLIIAFVLDPHHFKTMMSLMAVLSNATAGWPFSLLNPLALMMFPFTHIDFGSMISKVIGYAVIFGLIGYLTYRAYKTKTLSAAQFALSTVFISGLVVYLCYYAFKGASYQQWKFAGSVILPLSFLPITAVVSAFDAQRAIHNTIKYTFLIVLIAINIFLMNKRVAQSDIARYAPLRQLAHLDQEVNLKDINVDLKDDFKGTMIATQFINQKPLTLWSRSYFSEDKAENYTKLSRDNILVTNSCSVFDAQNMTMLGEAFCIIYGAPRLKEEFFIKFNTSLPSIIKTTGLSGQENWGRWSDGHKVVLEIPVNMEWRGVELNIEGAPFLPPGIMRQRMLFSVHGVKLKEVTASSASEIVVYLNREMFDNGYVSLTIDLPDAVSPSKFGSTDPRVLGFGFHSLQVRAER